jgi:choline transport protein
MIQGLVVLNYPNYSYERWHGTMIYCAFLALAALVNIFAIRIMPLLLHATFALHVGLWVVLITVICVISPSKNSAEFVFTTYINESGWSSDGVAFSIGLLSSAYVLAGQSYPLLEFTQDLPYFQDTTARPISRKRSKTPSVTYREPC